MLYDGSTYTAEIVGTEDDNDIAVLKMMLIT
jgi:S1-C subfamily serine protease